MSIRRLVRTTIVAAMVGFLSLEALAWARLFASDLVRSAFPIPAVTQEGTPVFLRWVSSDAGTPRPGIEVWGVDGSEIGVRRFDDPTDPSWSRYGRLLTMGIRRGGRSGGVDKSFAYAAFLPDGARPRDDASRIARLLTQSELEWRLAREGASAPEDRASWSFEAGQFVRRGADRRVLSIVGPAGTMDASAASDAGQFGRLLKVFESEADDFDARGISITGWEVDASRLVEFAVRPVASPARISIDVRLIPLRTPAVDAKPLKKEPRLILIPERAVAMDPDGTIWIDIHLGPNDGVSPAYLTPVSREDDAPLHLRSLVVSSLVDTGDSLAVGTRLRRQVVGQALQSWDFEWRPTGGSQQALAALACVPAVLRPLPLAAASFLSGAPTDGDSGSSWWWLDPVLASQHRPVVLGANLLLAALCAFIARRIARVHCATGTAATAWTFAGFLLGPLGLLLMRLLVVCAPAERVGRGRRSLRLDTCPATDTPWPEPARTGREIFVDA